MKLRRVIALQIGVLGPHVLTGCALGKGTCCIRCRVQFNWAVESIIVLPSSCLAVGRTVFVGSNLASLGLGSLSGGRRSG